MKDPYTMSNREVTQEMARDLRTAREAFSREGFLLRGTLGELCTSLPLRQERHDTQLDTDVDATATRIDATLATLDTALDVIVTHMTNMLAFIDDIQDRLDKLSVPPSTALTVRQDETNENPMLDVLRDLQQQLRERGLASATPEELQPMLALAEALGRILAAADLFQPPDK